MANYTARTRSNYFRVKDPAAFEAWCERRDLEFWTETIDGLGPCYAVTADTGDCAGWSRYDPETDEPCDLPAELADHLLSTDVAILMEIGNVKLRYLHAHATAIAADGKTVSVQLGDIYDKAAAAFPGLTITEARC